MGTEAKKDLGLGFDERKPRKDAKWKGKMEQVSRFAA